MQCSELMIQWPKPVMVLFLSRTMERLIICLFLVKEATAAIFSEARRKDIDNIEQMKEIYDNIRPILGRTGRGSTILSLSVKEKTEGLLDFMITTILSLHDENRNLKVKSILSRRNSDL